MSSNKLLPHMQIILKATLFDQNTIKNTSVKNEKQNYKVS